MGLGPSKSKIKDILQASCNDEKDAPLNYNDCIPYQNDCFTQVTGPSSFSAPDDMDKGSESMSMIEASSVEQIPITNKISKVNIRHYPYCAIGTLNVIYPDDSAVHQFTCFLIEANVVVTLGTNISNPNHSGKATNITTSFSPEKVTNIIFPDNFDKNKPDPDLAVLIYPNPVVEDWVGVKMASNDELSDKDILLMCSVGTKDTIDDKSVSSESKIDNSQTQNGESSVLTDAPPVYKKYIKYINNSEIHEVLTNLNAKMSVESNDPVLLQKCRGGPVYYKGYDGGPYVIGYQDKEFAVQQISKEAFKFLVKCVNEGKKSRKKIHKNIEEDKRHFAFDAIDEYIFFMEKLNELKQLPYIRVDKKNPQRQELTPAAKLIKEYSQAVVTKRKTLLTILYKVESSAADELLQKLKEFE